MTPERKKYLASISKEERIVRRVIDEQKSILRTCKEELNENCLTFSDLDYLYPMINSYKESIKVLKKELPAPKEKIDLVRNRYHMFLCPVCGASVDGVYCFNCGQKLR